MAEDVALEKGFKPLAYIRESVVISRNPADELQANPEYKTICLMNFKLFELFFRKFSLYFLVLPTPPALFC